MVDEPAADPSTPQLSTVAEPGVAPMEGPKRLWDRSGAFAVAAAAITIAVLVVLLGASGEDDPVPAAESMPTPAASRTPVVWHVKYKLTGTARGANLTYTDEREQIAQAAGRAVPLHSRTTGEDGITFDALPGTRLYFSAQNTGKSGDMTCEIEVNGLTVATNTSYGGFTIVTCKA